MNQEQRDGIRKAMSTCRVPEHNHDGIMLYLERGIDPGSFLQAVFENNLMEAVGQADHINLLYLHQTCSFVYSYAPNESHGSRERVKAWKEARRAESRKQMEATNG